MTVLSLCVVAAFPSLFPTASVSTASIETVDVGVYWDSDCQNQVSAINWSTLHPGMTKELPVHIRNEGNETAVLWLTTDNWDPPNASEYITLSWTYTGQIEPQEVQKMEFILTVSPEIEGITNFHFDIILEATKANAQITLVDLRTIHLNVTGGFLQGEKMKVKFYSYSGAYQGETTVWSGTTPAQIDLSLDLSQNSPIENAILVLTDNEENTILNIVNFVVHKSVLFTRITQIDIEWIHASPEERIRLFQEIIDIDVQWPYAPP